MTKANTKNRFYLWGACLVVLAVLVICRLNKVGIVTPHPWSLQYSEYTTNVVLREDGKLTVERTAGFIDQGMPVGRFESIVPQAQLKEFFQRACSEEFSQSECLYWPEDITHDSSTSLSLVDATGLPIHSVSFCYRPQKAIPAVLPKMRSEFHSVLEKKYGIRPAQPIM